MDKERQYREIELHSEDVQEVMGYVPPAIQRYGIIILLCIIGVLMTGSAIFSYPDTVEAELVVTMSPSPRYVKAENGNRLEQIFITEGEFVKKDAALGIMENAARTEDILYLRERMKEWSKAGYRIEQSDMLIFRHMPELGNVQNSYSFFLLSWNKYIRNLGESQTYETELMNAIAGIKTAISDWERNYLLTSPIDGIVSFMQVWSSGQEVALGETLFVILPAKKMIPRGKAFLPMDGIGKVRIGQRVIIRLSAFPEQEYGNIEGKLASVSPVPDSDNRYVLEISIPETLLTSYDKELPHINIMRGTACIVTKERSLLKRLLNW